MKKTKENKNIDWDFILDLEGSKLEGYVPNYENSKSGVTIASGFDLGARNENDLIGLPKNLIKKLIPYLGLKGVEAHRIANTLNINNDEMKIINSFAKNKTMNKLKTRYNKTSGMNFDDLPMHKATTIASVAFQYGNLESETPNFWKQVTSNNWKGAINNLLNFQDDYPTRRGKEAAYLIKGEKNQKKISPTTIDTAQYQSNELTSAPKLPDEITPLDSISKIEAPEYIQNPNALNSVPTSPAPIDDKRKEMFTVGNKYRVEGMETALKERKKPEYIPEHSISVDKKKSFNPYLSEENKTYPKTLDRKDHDSTYTAWDDFRTGFFTGKYDEIVESTKDLGDKYFKKYSKFFAPGVPPLGSGELPDEPIYVDEQEEFIGDENYDRLKDNRIINNPLLQRFTIGSNSYEETTSIIGEINKNIETMARLTQSNSIFGSLGITAAMILDPTIITGVGAINMARKAATTINRLKLGLTYSVAMALPGEVIQANQDPLYTGDRLLGTLAVHGLISSSLSAFKIPKIEIKMGRNNKNNNINNSNILIDRSKLNNEKPTSNANQRSSFNTKDATNAQFEEIEIIKIHDDIIKTSAYRKEVNQINNLKKAVKDNSYIGTDLKIERSSLTPTMRVMSYDPIVPATAQEKIMMMLLVDTGAFIEKNKFGITSSDNAETIMDVTINSAMHKTLFKSGEEFVELWGHTSKTGVLGNTVAEFKIKLGIKGSQTAHQAMARSKFYEEIAMALRTGDKHDVPYVQKSVNYFREYLNYIDEMAYTSKVYQRPFVKKIEELELKLKEIKDPKNIEKLKKEIIILKNTMKDLHKKGPMQNNAEGFFPRIYNHAAIEKDPETWHKLMLKDTRITNPNISEIKANLIAEQKTASILHNKGYVEIGDDGNFVNEAFSTKQRIIQLPDVELAPFLINDAEMVLKHYTKTMGMDIVLTNQFGDVTMKDALQNVRNQYDELILKNKDPKIKAKLKKKQQNVISDLEDTLARVRGTYGAPSDPHSIPMRMIRAFKSAGVVTHMGGAMISSIPDLGMVIMRHGLNDFTNGFKALFLKKGGLNDLLKQMNRKEIRNVAQGGELILGVRQMAMADVGDIFQNRTKFEEVLHNSTNLMMLLNGLNAWNSIGKELVSQLVTNDIAKLAVKYYKKSDSISNKDVQKLAMTGINLPTLKKIGEQVNLHSQIIDGTQYIINTAKWDIKQPELVLKFRYALNMEIKRTIVTPGAGDRALWTSTALGTLIAQYKSFSQAFVQKVMIRGAQEKDINFATGIVSMILLGALVVQLKRLLSGQGLEEDYNELFYAAILKSGTTGIFGDFHNIASVLTNGRLSAERLLGIEPTSTSLGFKASTVGGPFVSYIGGWAEGKPDLPFSSLPAVDIAKQIIP